MMTSFYIPLLGCDTALQPLAFFYLQNRKLKMKRTATLILLACSIQLVGQYKENIKIESLRKKPIIEAELNGKKGYFIVDTGSDITIVDKNSLKRYGLTEKKRKTDHKAVGFNGSTMDVAKVHDGELIIGKCFSTQSLYSIQLERLKHSIREKTGIKIIGIIGADVLLKYNSVIDYDKKFVTLLNKDKAANVAVTY